VPADLDSMPLEQLYQLRDQLRSQGNATPPAQPSLDDMPLEQLYQLRNQLRSGQGSSPVSPGSPSSPSPAEMGQATLPPVPVTPGQSVSLLSGTQLEGNMVDDRASIATEREGKPGELQQMAIGALKQGAAMGTEGVATGLGAAAGAALAPFTGGASAIALPGLASYGAHQFNKWAGLTPGEPSVLPQDVGDVVSLGAPMLPGLAQTAMRYSRAGRAMTTAEKATEEAEKVARQAYETKAAAQTQDEAIVSAKQQSLVQQAQQGAEATNTANMQAWKQEGEQRYGQAISKIQADQQAAQAETAQYHEALKAGQQAAEQHTAAVERLKSVPDKYMPEMPTRNVIDVRRDMAALEQGGATTQEVLDRLGVSNVRDASIALANEGEQLMQGGATMLRTGEPIPSPYAKPKPTLPGQAQEQELQQFIRKQGGIKLTDEELQGEFSGLLSRKETGTSGLQNNRSGKTAQQIAEAAQEQGYIPTADKESLLEALRQSVTEGKPVYRQGMEPVTGEPANVTAQATRLPGAKPQRASQVLFQRLDDVAGSAPVDMSPLHQAAAGVREQLATSMPSQQPGRLENILTDLDNMGTNGSVAQAHQLIKDLEPLKYSQNGTIRGASKQLQHAAFDAIAQSASEMPETAGARQIMLQAREVWRKEQALDDLRAILKPGGAVIRSKGGQTTLNPDNLINAFDRLVHDDKYFAGSFSPDELATLRADLASFQATPPMPTKQPPVPVGADAAPLPGLIGRQAPQPLPVQPKYPPPLILNGPEPYVAPPPVEPQLKPLMGRRAFFESIPLMVSAVAGHGPGIAVGAGLLTADAMSYVLAKALLNPAVRPMVLQWLQSGQAMSPTLYGVLGALATDYSKDGASVPPLPQAPQRQSLAPPTDRPLQIAGSVR